MLKGPKPYYRWEEVPLVLSTACVARLLDCSESTIVKLAANGTIKSFRLDRIYRFCRDDIRAFAEGATK